MATVPAGTKFIGVPSTTDTTERKSTQNNALSDVYTIEDINDTVGSGYTETIVNISSAQILAMGATPIELLPAPGSGKYYDIDKIIFEYNYGTTAYTMDNITIDCQESFRDIRLLQNAFACFVIIDGKNFSTYDGSDYAFNITPEMVLNSNVEIYEKQGVNPTLGDGTLRVKIYHKTITFGA